MFRSQALGQHFLKDQSYLERIVQAAALTPGDVVVEVGPGRGALTRRLVSEAGRVVAVELDAGLVEGLRTRFAGAANLQVIHGDARTVDPCDLLGGPQPYKLVANLPYYAALPILRRFLEARHRPDPAVVMVQREVAHQMTAGQGDMTLLSVAVQTYGEPRVLFTVPPGAFSPPPKVTSSVVRIRTYSRPAVDREDLSEFFGIVRAGFSAPRKQLRNSLSHGLGLAPGYCEDLLRRAGIDPSRRAETVSLEEWSALCHAREEASG